MKSEQHSEVEAAWTANVEGMTCIRIIRIGNYESEVKMLATLSGMDRNSLVKGPVPFLDREPSGAEVRAESEWNKERGRIGIYARLPPYAPIPSFGPW